MQSLLQINSAVEAWCLKNHVSVAVVTGRGRTASIVRVRQHLMAELLDLGYSSVEVGKAIRRDHSTVLYGSSIHRRRGAPAQELQMQPKTRLHANLDRAGVARLVEKIASSHNVTVDAMLRQSRDSSVRRALGCVYTTIHDTKLWGYSEIAALFNVDLKVVSRGVTKYREEIEGEYRRLGLVA